HLARENFRARDHGQPLLNFIEVGRERKAQTGTEHSTHHAEKEAVAEEDLHDAAIGSTERLEDSDVAGLLHDDHRKNGQDAETGYADNQEKEYIKNPFFNGDGRQERALFLFPGLHVVVELAREHSLQCFYHFLVIAVIFQLYLEVRG